MGRVGGRTQGPRRAGVWCLETFFLRGFFLGEQERMRSIWSCRTTERGRGSAIRPHRASGSWALLPDTVILLFVQNLPHFVLAIVPPRWVWPASHFSPYSVLAWVGGAILTAPPGVSSTLNPLRGWHFLIGSRVLAWHPGSSALGRTPLEHRRKG